MTTLDTKVFRFDSLKPHTIALAFVGVAVLIGQSASLIQTPLVGFNYDTSGYVQAAQHLSASPSGLVDATRTPGYPVFLAIVLAIAYLGNAPYSKLVTCGLPGQAAICDTAFQSVVYAQAVVAVLTLLLVYVLIYDVTRRRLTAAIAAALLAVNLYFGGWERVATSEFLSYCSLVTILLIFARFARGPSVAWGALLGFTCFVSIMIRPFNVFLPGLMLGLLLIRQIWRRQVAPALKGIVVAGAVVLVTVVGYMYANKQINNEFSLTWTTNVDEFGKVLEYRMSDLPVDSQYSGIQRNAVEFSRTDHPGQNPRDPYAYSALYTLSDSHFTMEGAFARQIIVHHPLIYIKRSIPDLFHSWTTGGVFVPSMGLAQNGQVSENSDWPNSTPGYTTYPMATGAQIPITFEPVWIDLVLVISSLTQTAYFALPLVILILVAYMWRKPDSFGGFILLCMTLAVIGGICLSAMGNYADFYRTRFPVDWMMIAIVVIGAGEFFDAHAFRNRGMRVAPVHDHRWQARGTSLDTGGITNRAGQFEPVNLTDRDDALGPAETAKLPALARQKRTQRLDPLGATSSQPLSASPQASPELSVVLPCLNEEEAIGGCIDTITQVIGRRGLNAEILVVDNASTDRSAEIARAHGARVVFQPLRGYGNAYLKGFAEARGRYIVMADADNTYDLNEIDAFVEPLRHGYDLVMGNRFAGGMAKGAMTWSHRYIGNPILSGILRLFFHTTVRDAHCGMRAFTQDAYRRMRLRTGGMEFASEMVINAAKAHLEIAERPISYAPRVGESKLHTVRDGWRHLRFMLLYSPTHLFLIPGLALLLLGLGVMTALLPAPLVLFGHSWDVHTMMLGSVIAIIGVQIVLLGLFARFFSLTEELDGQQDAILQWLNRWFNLERGLLIGLVIFLVGFGVDGYVLYKWVVIEHLGQLNEIRLTVFATSLLAIGAQIFFASFFLSFLQFRKSIHAVETETVRQPPEAQARAR